MKYGGYDVYAFLDTETTGFARGGVQPRIVSIAWMIAEGPKAVRTFKYSIVRPNGFEIPKAAAVVHGITTGRAIAEGKLIASVLADFATDLRTLQPKALVAHNMAYDLPIIASEFHLLGLINPCSNFSTICTMLQSRRRWPGQSAKLGDVYRRVHNEDMKDAHNAGGDVWACSKIFFHLKG